MSMMAFTKRLFVRRRISSGPWGEIIISYPCSAGVFAGGRHFPRPSPCELLRSEVGSSTSRDKSAVCEHVKEAIWQSCGAFQSALLV